MTQPAAMNPEPKPVVRPWAWVTVLALLLCGGVHWGILSSDKPYAVETLMRFGYRPGTEIWLGAYWALLTSVFVHCDLWHLLCNVYWLWRLGRCMEPAVGWLRYAIFFVVATCVSSAYQLAQCGQSGIGASGVLYGIFGYMWACRSQVPAYREVLTHKTIQLFLVWMVGCVIVEVLGIFAIGNAAHVSGFLFGVLVAGAQTGNMFLRRYQFGLLLMVVLALVPLAWCPWSVEWLMASAYRAHAAENYALAKQRYTQVLRLAPENEWARDGLADVDKALGQQRPEGGEAVRFDWGLSIEEIGGVRGE